MSERASPVFQAMLQRRSIRAYTDEPVSREDVLAMLEAARWAPSGKNRQPWRFLALLRGDARKKDVAAISKYQTMIDTAGALIVVLADLASCAYPLKDHQSVGAALQNMLLAAHDRGLGAVWIGEVMDRKAEVLAALNLDPQRVDFMALVAVGHPAEQGRTPRRLALEDLLLEPF